MIHKIIVLVFTAIGILLILIGISCILDYVYFADFHPISALIFGICFILLPIVAWKSIKYPLHNPFKKNRNNKEHIKFLAKIMIGFIFLLGLYSYDKHKRLHIISFYPKKTLEIKLLNTPEVLRGKNGSINGYRISDKEYPKINFELEKEIYNANSYKLKPGKLINITILKDSYQNKIVEPNTSIPKLFTLFGERRVIHIINIE